jgi:hypothetical protein
VLGLDLSAAAGTSSGSRICRKTSGSAHEGGGKRLTAHGDIAEHGHRAARSDIPKQHEPSMTELASPSTSKIDPGAEGAGRAHQRLS